MAEKHGSIQCSSAKHRHASARGVERAGPLQCPATSSVITQSGRRPTALEPDGLVHDRLRPRRAGQRHQDDSEGDAEEHRANFRSAVRVRTRWPTCRQASSSAGSETRRSSRARRSPSSPTSSARSAPAARSCSPRGPPGRQRLLAGELPDFLEETRAVREDDSWRVAEAPPDLQDRRVEITGPTDRKMVINALNSGARVFMADFEDANSPTWANLRRGPAEPDRRDRADDLARHRREELPAERRDRDAARPPARLAPAREARARRRRADVRQPVRLRPVHVPLGQARARRAARGPYFYLPKLESHLEARLWNDVFLHAQDALGIPRGTIRATVLIETILAAFEMEEILYELREHSAGLNAGRWDYIFSVIKKFRHRDDFVLPDRAAVTMTVPFMRAYTELLVKTCHGAARTRSAAWRRSSRAAATRRSTRSRSRRCARTRSREAGDGFDGTWVAHPDLVPTATEEFDRVLGDRPNQLDRQRPDVSVTRGPAALRAGHAGRDDRGRRPPERLGRHPVHRLVAERHRRGGDRQPDGGRRHRRDLALADLAVGAARPRRARARRSRSPTRRSRRCPPRRASTRRARVFEQVALADEFVEFLTLPAYELLG